MAAAAVSELLELNQKLLEAIMQSDWETYRLYCDPTLSCFEPEARGQLVEGLEFHQFYFGPTKTTKLINVTMCAPRVRMLGDDAAVLTYVRLAQSLDEAGRPQTKKCEETRVWHRTDGQWRHVHFHRSMNE